MRASPATASARKWCPPARPCCEALAAAQRDFRFEFSTFGWGGDWYRAHGEMMPADGLEALRGMDAILFGSAGDPHIPDHITLWGLRLKICQGFDQYANVRPTRILPGIDAPLKRCQPADLDWVIVRENSEGEYAGVGGRAHQGHPIEVATDVSMMTRAGVERIMRYAFRLAQSRPRKLLTVVTKSNAQRHAMVMWDEIAVAGGAGSSPTCSWDKELVDACTARMVNRPASLDTVVATNLHADILSDLAAALAGSLGIAPTGNIDPERRYPSMFEPIHGSAFDIMGKGLANPVGTFWSCVMLLEHIGEPAAARQLMQAIETVTANPTLHTRDLGGKATTEEVTNAVCALLAQNGAAARRLKPACADQLATKGNSSMKHQPVDRHPVPGGGPGRDGPCAARRRPAPRRTSCTGRPSRRAASRTCRRGTSRWCSRRSARPSTPSSSTRPAPAAR